MAEEQLHKIEDVGMHRLSPDGLSAFIVVAFIYSGFMNLIAFFADLSHEVQFVWITLLVSIFFGLWIVHGLFMLFFLSIERAFRYQRLQSVVVNIVFVKLTLDGYLLYLVDVKEKRVELMLIGLGSLALGVAYLLWSVRRARVNINKGETGREGKGLLYTGHCKLWGKIPVAFIVVLLIAVITLTFTGIGNAWFLLLAAPMQWILSYVYPEFYFLAYYKWVNPAFIYERPKGKKKG